MTLFYLFSLDFLCVGTDILIRYIGDLEEEIKEFQNQLAESRLKDSNCTQSLTTETAGTHHDHRRNFIQQDESSSKQSNTHSPSFTEGGGIRFVYLIHIKAR